MQNLERKMVNKSRFYQKQVNRELVENSQHIAHTINTMAVYLYMPGNNTTVRKQPDTSVADLNYILSELKTKIDSLTQQIETMDRSQRSRSQRKTEDPIYQEEVYEEVKENKSVSLEALCTKADLLFYGHGVTQDYKKAIDYYKEAAELGFGRACASLGILLLLSLLLNFDLIVLLLIFEVAYLLHNFPTEPTIHSIQARWWSDVWRCRQLIRWLVFGHPPIINDRCVFATMVILLELVLICTGVFPV